MTSHRVFVGVFNLFAFRPLTLSQCPFGSWAFIMAYYAVGRCIKIVNWFCF